MDQAGAVIVVGGTSGIGRAIAESYAARDFDVVITGRSAERAEEIAGAIGSKTGGNTVGIALDLASPSEIAERLAPVGAVQYLVLAAIERDQNQVREFNLEGALRLVTLKLVGNAEVIHTLVPRLTEDASILLFGGRAKDRPYPGSTTVSTVNGGVMGLINTLAIELAPIRVNAIHPGIVGDTPAWEGKPPAVLEAVRVRTPIGRLVTTEEVTAASVFLLENGAINGVNLYVDGGTMLA
jgi:NAD(P)-dependent dehydrogenase (short-subunit alcohol dehydrogenase family)